MCEPTNEFLPGLLLKLLAGAAPVGEVAAVRSPFLDPDAIGAFPDPMLVGLADEFGRERAIVRRGRRFLA